MGAPHAFLTTYVHYMSSVPRDWLLGLTASLRGLPVVVIGMGLKYGGHGVRIPATLRAAQVLHRVVPGAAMQEVAAD